VTKGPRPVSTVRIGIIGAGDIAKAHVLAARGLNSYFGAEGLRADVVALADRSPEVAARAAQAYDVERWTADWEQLVGAPDVDAVIVATPNDLHAPMAIAAAEAGKHVLCEKPLARDLASADAMVDAAERAGIVHSVNFNYRRIPAIGYARRLIEAGEIGDVVSFQGAFTQDWGIDPTVPRSWKFEASRAGAGPLLSLGCHVLDLAHVLVGRVDRVVSAAATHVTERPLPTGEGTYAPVDPARAGTLPHGEVDVEDLGTMLLGFAGGALGTFMASRLAPGRKNHCFLEISGTAGTIVFDYEHMNDLLVASGANATAGLTRIVVGPEHEPSHVWTLGGLGVGYSDTVVLHARAFVTAIRDGTPLEPSFRDGRRVHEVVDAAMRSQSTGRWEQVRDTA
jgi:predicted dehydrogenase